MKQHQPFSPPFCVQALDLPGTSWYWWRVPRMPRIEFQQISKRFPGVLALDSVSFSIEPGECHALMGENGAGKSTLGKILAGIYSADSGRILLDGTPIAPANPLEARRLGIAVVHQELAFCPNLSVAENLCLGDFPRRFGRVNRSRMRDQARAMLAQIDSDLPVETPIAQLSTGQEQMVQIAAALGVNASIIVMDEPTSSLSARESEHLFDLLGKLKQRGITIIYVSHRMEEIFRLCDRITVLRDGRHVATEPLSSTSQERVIQQMIGRELSVHEPRHVSQPLGEELLRVERLSSPGKFRDINFTVHAGEVVGLAGLVGAGRSEIAQAIFGLDPQATGDIYVRGAQTKLASPRQALGAGIGLLPEDRKRQGLVLSMNCQENSSLAALPSLTTAGFVRKKQERALAERYIQQLRVKTPALNASVSGLSGGNQQKIALAKWLACHCGILIVDEPTRGVDVGAKAEIHTLLDELACAGAAVLVISSELPEIMSLSRRIIVLREGVQMGELSREQFSQPALMRLMAGVKADPTVPGRASAAAHPG